MELVRKNIRIFAAGLPSTRVSKADQTRKEIIMKRFTGLMLLAVLSGGALLDKVTPARADSAIDQARQAVTDPNHVFDGARRNGNAPAPMPPPPPTPRS